MAAFISWIHFCCSICGGAACGSGKVFAVEDDILAVGQFCGAWGRGICGYFSMGLAGSINVGERN